MGNNATVRSKNRALDINQPRESHNTCQKSVQQRLESSKNWKLDSLRWGDSHFFWCGKYWDRNWRWLKRYAESVLLSFMSVHMDYDMGLNFFRWDRQFSCSRSRAQGQGVRRNIGRDTPIIHISHISEWKLYISTGQDILYCAYTELGMNQEYLGNDRSKKGFGHPIGLPIPRLGYRLSGMAFLHFKAENREVAQSGPKRITACFEVIRGKIKCWASWGLYNFCSSVVPWVSNDEISLTGSRCFLDIQLWGISVLADLFSGSTQHSCIKQSH